MLSKEKLIDLIETEHKGRYVDTFSMAHSPCSIDVDTNVTEVKMIEAVKRKVSLTIHREIIMYEGVSHSEVLEDIASDIWDMLYRNILEAIYDIESECRYGTRESTLNAIQALREKMIREK